jgi:NO-binding membrane sensor protein with MHYT domain
MLVGSYNHVLVFFSFVVAMLASYTALDMAGRVATSEGRAARWWLVGGAFSMGLGIWSMHFIGMLAFSLPIPLSAHLRWRCGWCVSVNCPGVVWCKARC